MEQIDLNGSWQFRLASTPYPADIPSGLDQWMPASVPGTVHQDLLANGKIDDPFVGMNENTVQWIDRQRWTYRREFELPDPVPASRRVELVAEGLDTYADVRINGRQVGRTENMFIGHRFNVKRFLRSGRNVLEVTFDSPTARSRALQRRHGRLRVALEPHRVYVRKAQYSFSWDWGPKLTTSGLWRPIRLEAADHPVLRHPFVRVARLMPGEARLHLSIELDNLLRSGLSLEVRIMGPGAEIRRRVRVLRYTVDLRMVLPRPHLWWPNGYGSQPLYQAVFNLLDGESVVHTVTTTFAVRTVRLVQERDKEGRSFVFEVNGARIFCKGADWIPGDSFLPRIADDTYERLLTLARDAHMNMVRVWGGGIYEQDTFYEMCDRLGLMVWQDFMFACGEYPDAPWFLRAVGGEARTVVQRLRNHPCIVVWCGNNECEWLFCVENPTKTPDDMTGAVIFRDLLRSAVREHDGTRPYWRSSPFGSGFPNDVSNGNRHHWEVWSFWKDYPEYTRDTGRFVTEFGFQAPANLATLASVLSPADRHPHGLAMEHHNKQVEGMERLFRFQAAHLGVSTEFEEFIQRGQLTQAFALQTAVEHWRRRKFRTAGTLFWQLNDCWPVCSWSVIDSALRPKAAYYAAKRFFAPILLSLTQTDRGVEAWAVNDRLRRVPAILTTRVLSFDGRELERREMNVTLKANASMKLALLTPSALTGFDPLICYVEARLRAENELESESRFFFAEPKHLQLPPASITTEWRRQTHGPCLLRLTSDSLVRAVVLSVDGEDILFSDNWFDLDPGITRTISFAANMEDGLMKKRLRVRSLAAGVMKGDIRTTVKKI
ncbi:MAG: glycoside hydrolase family 2 protein [Bacteroidota bacterium]